MSLSWLCKAKPLIFTICLLLLIPSLAACSKGSNSNTAASSSRSVPGNAVQVGVLVNDTTEATRKRYQPLLDELSKAIGRPVVFKPMRFTSQFLEVEQGEVDFVITNPLATVQLQRLHNTEVLASVSRPKTGTDFAGSIIVKSDSPIKTIEDLRDKDGACVSMVSGAAGCLFQMYHLKQNGVNPLLDVAKIKDISSQDKIVQAVLSGEAEFGFVRMDQIQRMVDRDLIPNVDVVRVIEPANDSFPFPHTTQLYPGWAISASQDVPAELVSSVQQTLLNLPAKNPALVEANIEQLVPAADYSQLEALIEDMKLRGSTKTNPA
ncbi:MAG: phosphate/phosphite/phosphonate ABC transporter substrate-binding protein [Elainellaceae cyanobacterium]